MNEDESGEVDEVPDRVRSAQEIARRSLALFGVYGLSTKSPREDILAWLKETGLWDELSPLELKFVTSEPPTQQQSIDASWRSEGLTVLLWALGKIEKLPQPDEQCDTAIFQELLPPFIEVSEADFITSATRRSDAVLLEMADALLDFHWQACEPALLAQLPPPHPHRGIARERQHAINWVIGYDGASWDDVGTDT
jgi:hypothetical protein